MYQHEIQDDLGGSQRRLRDHVYVNKGLMSHIANSIPLRRIRKEGMQRFTVSGLQNVL